MQLLIQGRLVSISHLKPIVRTMTLDLRGGYQKKNARLEFRFSCHCYSRRPANGVAIPADLLVRDGSKHEPRDRIFCQMRYNQSITLVQHIDDLINTNGLVQRSRHLNFFSTHVVTVDAHGVNTTTPYYIFMDATKKQDTGHPPKLDIFVESAYLEDPNIPSPSGIGAAMHLSELLGRVWVSGSVGGK